MLSIHRHLKYNLLSIEREGRTGPVQHEQAGLVSSLVYGFGKQIFSAYDRFYGNGPYYKTQERTS